MRTPSILLTLLVLAAGCGGESDVTRERRGASEGRGNVGETAVVASVTDGDTIRLEDGRRVRLVQIDAPEVNGQPECGGDAAADALRSQLTRGARVKLRADRVLDSQDQHGRLLRYVFHEERNLNVWLVGRGHAAPYFYRGERGRWADDLEHSARTARATLRGFWGSCPGTRLEPWRGVATGRVR